MSDCASSLSPLNQETCKSGHSVTQNQAHLPDLWKKLFVSKDRPSKNMGIKPTTNQSRTLRATFSGDPALELGPVFLKDKNIHHGGNEDRRRDPRFHHLRNWKAVTMTTDINQYRTCSINYIQDVPEKLRAAVSGKTTREGWQRESKVLHHRRITT